MWTLLGLCLFGFSIGHHHISAFSQNRPLLKHPRRQPHYRPHHHGPCDDQNKPRGYQNFGDRPITDNQNRPRGHQDYDDRPIWGSYPKDSVIPFQQLTDQTTLGPKFSENLRISQKKCVEYCWDSSNKPQAPKRKPGFFQIAVVGGVNSKPNEFPHMAAVGFGDPANPKSISWNSCGGSLVSDQFVMTAAHCTESSLGIPSVVRLGALNVNNQSAQTIPEDINVKEVLIHPEYVTGKSIYNDIALLRLERKVTFREGIQPGCLFDEKEIPMTKAIATGWGNTGFGDAPSDILQKVELDIIPNGECTQFHPSDSSYIPQGILSSQICAGVLAGGKDTCVGDSGGPIQINNARVTRPGVQCGMEILGVTSFGKFCAEKNSPGVYTRISSYIDWIENIVWSPEV